MAQEPLWRRLGYSTRYQYRNAQAKAKGFTSYRAQRTTSEKSRGKTRDYEAERKRANQLSQSRGFASANRERGVKESVSRMGITWTEFLRMNQENIVHWREINSNRENTRDKFPYFIHKYTPPKNKASSQYVKYVVSYYHAIVDEKHNWNSKRDESGQWEMVDKALPNGEQALVPKSDKWWYVYLVEASELYSVDYYEGRYGKH